MKITKNLTEGNVYRNLLAFVIPTLLAALLRETYIVIDAVIAGKCINELALGAIQSTSPVLDPLYAIFNGFSAGFGIYISHLFGRKDFAAIKRDAVHVTSVVSVAAVLFSALLIVFCNPIIRYLQVDPILQDNARIYFIIYSAGALFTFLNPLLTSILAALGVTKVSLYTTLVSAVLNLGGNLFTVLVLDMGVAGLALATVFSTASAILVQILALRSVYRELKSAPVSYRFSFSGLRRSARYTFPAAFQLFAVNGVNLFIGPIVNGLDALATTGNSVANRLFVLSSQTIWAAGSAFGTYTAQSAGEGNYGKIRKGIKAGFVVNFLLLLPCVLLVSLFAEPLVSLFFPAGYEGLAFDYAANYARFVLPFLYVQLVGHLFHCYLRSLGCIGTVFWISFSMGLVRLLFVYLLAPSWGLYGVFAALVIYWFLDMCASFVVYFFFYRSEKQVKGRIRRVLG